MKTAITIWVLTTENTDGLGVTVDTFADYESAKKKMEEIAFNLVDHDKKCNVWGTDVFRAIMQGGCTYHINIHPQTVEVEIPDVAPQPSIWVLTRERGDATSIMGLYNDKKRAYEDMCVDFKNECNATIGNSAFNSCIDENSADFEPDNALWIHWRIYQHATTRQE